MTAHISCGVGGKRGLKKPLGLTSRKGHLLNACPGYVCEWELEVRIRIEHTDKGPDSE